ncbi:unnamed protein product, partial [Effrenium voratum]
ALRAELREVPAVKVVTADGEASGSSTPRSATLSLTPSASAASGPSVTPGSKRRGLLGAFRRPRKGGVSADRLEVQQELLLARERAAEALDAAETQEMRAEELQKIKNALTLQLTEQQRRESELETELETARGSESELREELERSSRQGADVAAAGELETQLLALRGLESELRKELAMERSRQGDAADVAAPAPEGAVARPSAKETDEDPDPDPHADRCLALEAEQAKDEARRAEAEAKLSAEEAVAAKEALARSKQEQANLAARLEDMEYALQIASEAAAEDAVGEDPIGVRE